MPMVAVTQRVLSRSGIERASLSLCTPILLAFEGVQGPKGSPGNHHVNKSHFLHHIQAKREEIEKRSKIDDMLRE